MSTTTSRDGKGSSPLTAADLSKPCIIVPTEGRLYADGTTLPLLGARLGPDRSTSLRLDTSESVDLDYAGTYIVLGDYTDPNVVDDYMLQSLADRGSAEVDSRPPGR